MGVMSGNSVSPNSVTYNSIINGFCKLGKVAFVEEVRNDMINAGVKPDVRPYATLIDCHARRRCLDEALRLCDDMVERGLMPNTVVYNSIFHWLYMGGDIGGASLVSSDMIDKHVFPDKFTYSTLIKGALQKWICDASF
ncbi:hypothetical protein REPUB_Repub14bG0146800 [Reevesia pubescens]